MEERMKLFKLLRTNFTTYEVRTLSILPPDYRVDVIGSPGGNHYDWYEVCIFYNGVQLYKGETGFPFGFGSKDIWNKVVPKEVRKFIRDKFIAEAEKKRNRLAKETSDLKDSLLKSMEPTTCQKKKIGKRILTP